MNIFLRFELNTKPTSFASYIQSIIMIIFASGLFCWNKYRAITMVHLKVERANTSVVGIEITHWINILIPSTKI